MHPGDGVTRAHLVGELSAIGVEVAELDVQALDQARGAVLVRLVSASFEGQTYLDREMRVRPAIVRAFAMAGHRAIEAVLDLLAPDELDADAGLLGTESGPAEGDPEERASKREWRDAVRAILSVLRLSRYTLDTLEDFEVYVATRPGLASERVLIGFATSPRVTTVDIGVRASMETARQAEPYQSAYYLVPAKLDVPFANQKPARWLHVLTPREFLHLLNSSAKLASNLVESSAKVLSPTVQLSGPVIEPACHCEGDLTDKQFFDHVQDWMATPEASLLVLMAPAGHGKTTLTLELTRRLAEKFREDQTACLPLFVPFQSVRRTVDFEALLHRRMAELGGGSYAAYAELLKMGSALLIVDGFDELADDAGMQAAENQVRSIRPLLQGKAKVLLAGRTAFASHFGGNDGVDARMRSLLGELKVSVLNVRRFDTDQIGDFVRTRTGLSQSSQTDVLAFRDASPDHQELCSNPLFLLLLCSLAHVGGLPTTNADAAPDIEALLVKVCEREEERQHLALGVERQLQYLGDLAVEQFRRGESSVARPDARLAAELLVDPRTAGPEIVGRLLDHALLTARDSERLAFLHPLVRDAILARAIEAQLNEPAARALRNTAVDQRDLPEATVRLLALSGKLLRATSGAWLSSPSLPSAARRNLFRVAICGANAAENPRHWWDPAWTDSASTIRQIDMAALTFDARSFDGLRFDACLADGAVFSDCDFRGTVFDACSFTDAAFLDCRASKGTRIARSIVGHVLAISNGSVVHVASAEELLETISPSCELPASDDRIAGTSDATVGTRDENVRQAVSRLLRAVLEVLVSPDGTRFHTAGTEELELPNLTHSERRAVAKVIAPGVLSTFCERELRGGSREVAWLDSRWRPALAKFMKTGRMSPGLADYLGELVAKSARYLD